MLLVLTNSEDATASFLLQILTEEDIAFYRIDTDSLSAHVRFSYRGLIPRLKLNGVWLGADEVSNIWYRRPERLKDRRFDRSPEGRYTLAEWTECVEGFFAHIPEPKWVNHPARNTLASHKIEQLSTARDLGFAIPDTLVTQSPAEVRSFQKQHEAIIAKPMANGYIERKRGQRDSLIYTNVVTAKHAADLGDIGVCPTLFQECIPKSYDVRITVVDDHIHAMALFASDNGQQRCDIRRNNMSDVRYEPLELPRSVKQRVKQLLKRYGLRFAAIDMAVSTTGRWYFFEINPNGQWAWLDMCAGSSISTSFVQSFSESSRKK
jgi:Prokaryotic glutathione synthetase, ATP-grasp domain